MCCLFVVRLGKAIATRSMLAWQGASSTADKLAMHLTERSTETLQNNPNVI
jgi:hypothetical protein